MNKKQKNKVYLSMTQEERNYFNVHAWIKRIYGKASKCENPNCTWVKPKMYHWALIKGKQYEKNIENFMQLCPSCHIRYDFTETTRQKMKVAAKNNHFSINNPMKKEKNRAAVSQLMRNSIIPEERRRKQSERMKGCIPNFIKSGKKYCSNGLYNGREVVDESTGQIYNSLKAAATDLAISYSKLKNSLRIGGNNKTTLRWTQK